MKMLLVALSILASLSSFASEANINRPSTQAEKSALCRAVDQSLEEQEAEAAVNMRDCLKAKLSTIGNNTKGFYVVGDVPLDAAYRKFKLFCSGSLNSQAISYESVVCR